MIERFSILYAGHVNVDNLGYAGTPANDRFLSDEDLASALTITDELAQTADRLGYHTLWMAEHHFQREGYECLPNLLMQSVHLAHITKNLKFGCAFNVPPMWNPLRLAEDYALADHLTDGRVIFGVGRGYHTREVESFGAPMLDRDANRDLFRRVGGGHVQGFQQPLLLPPRQILRYPSQGALPRLRVGGDNPGAQAQAPAR